MEHEQQPRRGRFGPGNKAGAGGRRTFRTFFAQFERETGRQAVQRALETSLADARAHLAVYRARQVAPRVMKADKRRAAREARFWTAQIVALCGELRPFVLVESAAPVSPDDAIARLNAAARRANGHD